MTENEQRKKPSPKGLRMVCFLDAEIQKERELEMLKKQGDLGGRWDVAF